MEKKHVWREEVLETADVTKREGYPCARCPKDGLVSCQWRKCRDYQPFFRQAWRDAVRPLKKKR